MLQNFLQKIRVLLNRKKNATYHGPRKGIARYDIRDSLRLEVYWKVLEIGRGPGISLYAFEEEVLRFDCFGENRGHYHVNLKQLSKIDGAQNRLYFRENSVEDQIKRAAFELTRNLSYYLQRNRQPKIQNLQWDAKKLEAVVRQASDQMLYYFRTVSELKYPG